MGWLDRVDWLETSHHYRRTVDPLSGHVRHERQPPNRHAGVCILVRGQWHGLLFKQPPAGKRYFKWLDK